MYILHKIDIPPPPPKPKLIFFPPKCIDIFNVFLDLKVKNALHVAVSWNSRGNGSVSWHAERTEFFLLLFLLPSKFLGMLQTSFLNNLYFQGRRISTNENAKAITQLEDQNKALEDKLKAMTAENAGCLAKQSRLELRWVCVLICFCPAKQ